MAFTRAKLRAAAARYYEDPIARALIWLRVGPNAVTLLGLALAGVTASLIAMDHLLLGGLMLIVSAGLDSIDGAVARMSGKASPAGALLDSVVDRVAEGVVLFGVLWLAVDTEDDLLRLRSGGGLGVREGENVRLHPRADRIHFFDAATGVAVGRSTETDAG